MSVFDVLNSREKVDARRAELLDALEEYRKIFSSPFKPEFILEELGLDFHNVNTRTRDFIRTAMRHVEELENSIEKHQKVIKDRNLI